MMVSLMMKRPFKRPPLSPPKGEEMEKIGWFLLEYRFPVTLANKNQYE